MKTKSLTKEEKVETYLEPFCKILKIQRDKVLLVFLEDFEVCGRAVFHKFFTTVAVSSDLSFTQMVSTLYHELLHVRFNKLNKDYEDDFEEKKVLWLEERRIKMFKKLKIKLDI